MKAGFPIVIEVPRSPVSLNVFMRLHWSKRLADKKDWANYLWHLVDQRKRKRLIQAAALNQKMRVSVHVQHPRLFDEDNLHGGGMKPLFDALKQCGYIHDDSPRFVERNVTQVQHRERRTVVSLEPLEGRK